MRLLTRLAVSVVAVCLAASARAQVPAKLGPVDGAGLPALDTGRVAVGTVAPDLTLETKEGAVTLSQFRGKKTVVLVFYRGGGVRRPQQLG